MCEFVNEVWTPCADPNCPSKRPAAIDLLREAMKTKREAEKPQLTPRAKRQIELLDQLESIVHEHLGGGKRKEG